MASLPGETPTILLVEDDVGLRTLESAVLRGSGYQVLIARDGSEAVALAAARGGPIHLLVTDVMLPGMPGPALAAALGKARPGLKTLYLSGYSPEALTDQGYTEAAAALLTKPFTVEALVERVRQLLGR